jgi:chromosome segregation ATPase
MPATEIHQPGSIVRIKVKNFVTYTAAEFKCGPSLNMIIGPNGTGKSTLVCAICLGLGSKPSVLGRAKDIGEYVKHGQREAEIEVELAAGDSQNRPNPVIHLTIRREGNKSSWMLNGTRTTHQEVNRLVHSYHIQIDNLCQFLPQDRVVEFAAMSPVQLLESTQKAAAPEQMTEWHNQLKQLGADRKQRLTEQQQSKTTLDQLNARQNAQRADVERMTERLEMLTKVKALEKCRPAIKYRFEKAKWELKKDRMKEAQKELKELENEVRPALQNVENKKAYKAKVQRLVQTQKGMVERAESNAKNIAGKLEVHKKKLDDCDVDVKAEVDGSRKAKVDMQTAQQQLTRLRNRQNEAPPEFDHAAFNVKIREKKQEYRQLKGEQDTINEGLKDLANDKSQKHRERDQVRQEMTNLKSQSGQQLHKLQQASPQTLKAWSWVQKNQNIFTEKIYGPAMLECSLPDTRYANAVESLIPKNEFLALTATNSEDWRKLQKHLIQEMGLSDVYTRNSSHRMAHYNRPVTEDELEGYGLDTFAIDLITGPEPILSMLCENRGLHRAAISLRNGTTDQFYKLKDSPIQHWVTGNQINTVTRRPEYGPNAVSTGVSSTRPARFWTGQAVDMDQQQCLQERVRDVELALATIDEQFESSSKSLPEINRQLKEIETAVVSAKRQDLENAQLT